LIDDPASPVKRKGAPREMPHIFKLRDDVRHLGQGPQGRMTVERPTVYTVVQQLPVEADGRIRYRIKSQSENFERVVTEDQLSPYR
jgi:hypothetical protein